MSREAFRSIGAMVGLLAGVVLMRLFDHGGVVWGAVYGAGGALAGGVLGEQVHGLVYRNK